MTISHPFTIPAQEAEAIVRDYVDNTYGDIAPPQWEVQKKEVVIWDGTEADLDYLEEFVR